jgi:hypothetical protein
MTCIPSTCPAQDPAAAPVEVAVDLAHVLLRDPDLHGHDRLEQGGLRLEHAVLERHRGGDLERQLVRVDVVEGAVVQRRLEVESGKPAMTPSAAVSRMPFSTPGRSPSGTDPPTTRSANSTPPPGFGSSSSQTSPNIPWPPVCFL